jgi:hypothetical protein
MAYTGICQTLAEKIESSCLSGANSESVFYKFPESNHILLGYYLFVLVVIKILKIKTIYTTQKRMIHILL